jgi:CRP/FNR family transcriptional regulator, cyclic AMP receptor protein
MKERFEGKSGKRRLIDVFTQQEIVQNNQDIARKLAEISLLEEIQNGKQIYVERESGKNVLFFIIGGKFELFIKDRKIRTLESGSAFGEFPIVDPSLTYTVTAVASEQSVVARVSEEQFLAIAREYPEIWKNIAKMLVARLRKNNEATDESQKNMRNDLKPGDLTLGQLMSGLKFGQLWTMMIAFVGALAGIATVAYKMGSGAW